MANNKCFDFVLYRLASVQKSTINAGIEMWKKLYSLHVKNAFCGEICRNSIAFFFAEIRFAEILFAEIRLLFVVLNLHCDCIFFDSTMPTALFCLQFNRKY